LNVLKLKTSVFEAIFQPWRVTIVSMQIGSTP